MKSERSVVLLLEIRTHSSDVVRPARVLDDDAAALDFTAEVTLSTPDDAVPLQQLSMAPLVHIHFLAVSPPLASLVALSLAMTLFPSPTPLSDLLVTCVSVFHLCLWFFGPSIVHHETRSTAV